MIGGRVEAVSLAGALALFVLLSGCAQSPSPPPTRVLPPPNLTAAYAAAATAGQRVYRLNAAASQVLILVGKSGPLATFGHTHVIRVGALQGFVLSLQNGTVRGDLRFPVRALEVDLPGVRKSLGPPYAAHQPDPDARRGTRANMLGGDGLNAARYPRIRLHITATAPSAQDTTAMTVAITLHGVTRTIAAPASYARSPVTLRVEGRFELKQSDFGIAPYSALLGALRVENRIEIRYHLDFERWCPAPANRPC